MKFRNMIRKEQLEFAYLSLKAIRGLVQQTHWWFIFLTMQANALDFKSSLPEKVPSNEEYERKQQFGSKYLLINNLAICSIEI